MPQLWIATVALNGALLLTIAPAAPQNPIAPAPAPGGQQAPLPQNPQGQPNQLAPPSSAGQPGAASRPAMSMEELVSHLQEQLTGLAGRVQSLRNLAHAGPVVGTPTEIPKATTSDVKQALGELSREIHKRAHPIELSVAGGTTERLAKPEARKIPTGSFKPAPELKQEVQAAPARPVGPQLPDADPAHAADIIFKVGAVPILRGDLEVMVAAMAKYAPESTREILAQRALNGALIPLTLRKDKLGTLGDPVMAKAKALRDEIKAGKQTFEAAAKETSDDPSTKPFGGLMDDWKPGLLTPFEHVAISNLKPGEIAEPFMTKDGVEIIQLLEISDTQAKPADASLKMRRILLSFNLPNDILQLFRSAKVEVYDAKFEPFLPAQINRVFIGSRLK